MSKAAGEEPMRKAMADPPPGTMINISVITTTNIHVALVQDSDPKNAVTVTTKLQTAGTWALSIAEKLGLAAAAEAIKRAITPS